MRVKIAGYEMIIGYTLSLTIMLDQGLASAGKCGFGRDRLEAELA